jgi:Eco57I restriction-modification methylase/restriction endonuclease TaqI-like protein
MKPADCQPQLQKKYLRETWHALLPQLLPGVEMFSQAHDFPLTSEHERGIATARRQFGAATLADGKRIAFYEIEVSPDVQLLSNRVGLRSLIVKCIDEVSAHAVLAFFVQPGKSFYRLTYAAKESRLGEDLKIQTEQTSPRRFTYILGEGESCRTAAERFGKLPSNTKISDLTEAFSVDKLNKEFFADFRNAFDLVAKDILARNKGWEQSDAERETQTLLNRLLFLYFIQRKGWLDRRRNYLISAFNPFHRDDPNGTSFNDKFLKSFFVKLSAEDAYFPNMELGDLPFLNGGLFDDEIGSLTERGRMKVGNQAFRHVFDRLLEAYNFTVREDTPLDQEVAIDPEMIGKIFESLVLQLEQSDSGGKTSRHDTGSYYTPRPIVHYLCREGLRAWMEQFPPSNAKSGDWPTRLEKLFVLDASDGIDDTERDQLNELITPDEASTLLERLDDFRACDPAVGSGAFLVGLLHELVNLRRLCETRARGKDPAADIEWIYETKKRVIEKVLYGVDIQRRAVEICKLRLWISLMVDYPLEVDPDNCALPEFRKALKKITPLPNLDFKIRRADSLIEYIRGHAVNFPEAASDSRDFALSLNKLATAKHRFYEARRKKDKRDAQLDIIDATAELAQYEFNAAKLKFGLLPSDTDADRVAELARAEAEMGKLQMQIAVARKKGERDKDEEIERLNRVFNDEAKPTFVWQLDFAEIFHRNSQGNQARTSLLADEARKEKLTTIREGFDLIVGNPPFGATLKEDDKERLKTRFDHIAQRIRNSFLYFIGVGYEIVKDSGVVCLILPNEFLFQIYMTKIRAFLLDNAQYLFAVNLGEEVFEAIVPTCLIGFRKTTLPAYPIPADDLRECKFEELSARLRTNLFPVSSSEIVRATPNNIFTFNLKATALVNKLSANFTPFGEFCEDVANGICTSCDEVYIVTSEFAKQEKFEKQYLKPCIRGGQINRFLTPPKTDELVLYITDDFDPKKGEKIYEYLTENKSLLIRKCVEKKSGSRDWHILFRSRYEGLFNIPKIMIRQTGDKITATPDTEVGYYCINSVNVAQLKKSAIPRLNFFVGLLNSTLLNFFYREISQEGGRVLAEVKPQRIRALPIPSATQEQSDLVSLLVSYVIHLTSDKPTKTSDTTPERDELMRTYYLQIIDALVYELFFPDELHNAKKYFFKHLAEENLPSLDEIKGDKTAKLRSVFERFFDKEHVIRKNGFFLDTLESVRIIEGKA